MKTIPIALVCLYIVPAAYADAASYYATTRMAVPYENALHQRSEPFQSLPTIRQAANHGTIVPPSTVPISTVEKVTIMVKSPTSDVEQYFKMGVQNHNYQRYELAVASLTRYISLTPNNPQRIAVLLIIGKSLQEMNRAESALEIYGRIIEQYPDRPEALLSMIAMADIGVANPALNYPVGKKGSEYVRDPIMAYDTARMKKVPAPMIEHIQYQKGHFLWKIGRYKESCTVQKALLKEFPLTGYRTEAIGMIKASTLALFRQYHQSGDHISAATLFFEARKDGLIGAEDGEMILKGAISLAYLGLHDVALQILSSLQTSAGGITSSDIEKTKTEIEKTRVIGAIEQPLLDKKWDLFESAQAYLSDNNPSLADKTLLNLKKTSGEAFWSKIAEYALEENRWIKKYQGCLTKK